MKHIASSKVRKNPDYMLTATGHAGLTPLKRTCGFFADGNSSTYHFAVLHIPDPPQPPNLYGYSNPKQQAFDCLKFPAHCVMLN